MPEPRLTHAERIREYLAKLPTKDLTDRDTWPFEATQDGIAEAMGIARAHVALELKKLEARLGIDRFHAHVGGQRNRRWVYRAAPARLVRSIIDLRGRPIPLVDGRLDDIHVVTLSCYHCGRTNRVALQP